MRRGNPPGWLARLIASMQRFPAGMDHRLVVILKGFEGDDAPVRAQAPGAEFIAIDDSGFDIGAYRHAAGVLDCERCLFLNSHVAVEGAGWLAHLSAALDLPGSGAVGATASWERHSADAPFPNPHLRTSGFLIDRRLFLSLDFGPLASKRDGNLFEGGPNSMTRQLAARGLSVRMVGRHGHAVEPEDWPEAGVFRSGNQENLMLSDNRTRDYQTASLRRRRKLAHLAWGDRAAPRPRPMRERLAALLGR